MRFKNLKPKTLIITLSILFLTLRVPLIWMLFFHIDDTCVSQGMVTTYPLITNILFLVIDFLYRGLDWFFKFDTPLFLLKVYSTRLASLLLSLSSFILFLTIVKKIFKRNIFLLFAGCIISFSQMHIIYSVHSGPYGYSLMSYCLYLYFLLNFYKYKLKTKEYLLCLFGLAITPYIDNFSIVFLPALFFAIVYQKRNFLTLYKKEKEKIIVTLIVIILNGLTYLKLILFPILKNVGDGTNYNRGSSNEFIFIKQDIWEAINEPLKTACFFLKNTFFVIENNLAFYPYLTLIENVYCIIIFSVFLFLGIVFLTINSLKNKVLFFILLSLVSIYFLVYLELLSLAPTRHLLGTIVFLLIIVFYFLESIPITKKQVKILLLSTIFLIISTSTFTYPRLLSNKKQKINFEKINSIVKAEKIDFIIDYERSSFFSHLFPQKNYEAFKNQVQKTQKNEYVLLFISHRTPIANSNVLKEIAALSSKSTIKILKSLIHETNVQVGRSPVAKNGSNNYYIYIVKYST